MGRLWLLNLCIYIYISKHIFRFFLVQMLVCPQQPTTLCPKECPPVPLYVQSALLHSHAFSLKMFLSHSFFSLPQCAPFSPSKAPFTFKVLFFHLQNAPLESKCPFALKLFFLHSKKYFIQSVPLSPSPCPFTIKVSLSHLQSAPLHSKCPFTLKVVFIQKNHQSNMLEKMLTNYKKSSETNAIF